MGNHAYNALKAFLQLLKPTLTLPGLLMCAIILPDHSVSFTLIALFSMFAH